MLSAIKRMNMDSFSYPWRSGHSCDSCSLRFTVFHRKKVCIFCKCVFCNLCIMRRPDKKLSCRKCQILTARPLDRDDLLNLRSRDLVNYLTSKHISTSGCVEKEDLVNALIRAVNNSSYHAASSAEPSSVPSGANSYPNSPHRDASPMEQLSSKRKHTQSVEDLFISHDGIRVTPSSASCSETGGDRLTATDLPTVMVTDDNSSTTSDFIVINQNDEVNVSDIVEISESVEPQVEDPPPKTEDSCVPVRPLMLSDFTSKEELQQLSIKQLKELLMRNRTDYKGCVEKAELVDKVSRLWADYMTSRKDLEKLTLDELCKICMDAPIECVLLECGHMATCTACGKQLCECPICRQFVVRCVRTFKA